MAPELRSAILATRDEHPDWGHRKIAAACGTSRDSVRRALRFATDIADAAADARERAASGPAAAAAGVDTPGPVETAQAVSGPRRVAVSALRPLSDEDWRHRPPGRDPLSSAGFPW